MSLPAIVLSGERPGGNALAQAFDLPASVFVDVAGQPSIVRVVETLEAARSISGGLICGPDTETRAESPIMQRLLEESSFSWIPPAAGPAESALAALEQQRGRPALLTAADHALLTPEIVDNFVNLALLSEADFVVGLVPYRVVKAAYPQSKRTVLKFADGEYCGSNLFLIRSDRGLELLKFWRQIAEYRKRPWKMAREIGLSVLLAYLTGRLTIGQTLHAIGERAGCRVGYVEVLAARAAVDVDSIADHALAEEILSA